MNCLELIYFSTIRVEYCNFLNLYGRYVLWYEWVVFNNFLLIDATDRSKISSNHCRIFFDVSLYPLSLFANTPFKVMEFIILKDLKTLVLWISRSMLDIDLLLIYRLITFFFDILHSTQLNSFTHNNCFNNTGLRLLQRLY